MAEKTLTQIKDTTQAFKEITVPDALLDKTDSIVKGQISELKQIIIDLIDKIISLENRITDLEGK